MNVGEIQGDIFDKKGRLIQTGYAFREIEAFDCPYFRKHKPKFVGKETLSFTYNNYGFLVEIMFTSKRAFAEVVFVDYMNFHMNRVRLRGLFDGVAGLKARTTQLKLKSSGGSLKLTHEDGNMHLEIELKNKVALYTANIVVKDTPNDISSVRGFGNPSKPNKYYYVTTKSVCALVSGKVTYAGTEQYFVDSPGCYIFARSRMPRVSARYYSELNTYINGKPFAFSISNGPGRATSGESVFYYDNNPTKLNDVHLVAPFSSEGDFDFLLPWNIYDDAGKFELKFYPVADACHTFESRLRRKSRHRIAGTFYGKATANDGTIIKINGQRSFIMYLDRRLW